MFEAVEVGHKLDKASYAELVPELRMRLIDVQFRVREAKIPVLIVVAGDDHPGCDDVLQLLNEWFDARFVETNAYGPPTEGERSRPRFWRYWRDLTPRGKIGLFTGAWASRAIADRVQEWTDEAKFLRIVDRVERFEQAMVDDGAVVLKFWLHLPKEVLEKRLKEAEKHPDREWRVHPEDWQIYESLEKNLQVVETFLRQTSTGTAPWHLIESTDAHYRDVTISQILLDTVESRLKEVETQASPNPPPTTAIVTPPANEVRDPRTVLDKVDLTRAYSKAEYDEQLNSLQVRINHLSRAMHEHRKSAVLLFEGWDAAGKGSTIRRLVRPLRPQLYRIVPIAAPTDEERAHHYLWRFWRHLPRPGKLVIFDRSWYGRVLVERVEGFATQTQWRRAYREINDFEEQLVEHGFYLGKFWLHISQDEQLQRFQARENTPFKQFKITEEDYRNREKWPAYEAAVGEMVARTSSSTIPWNLIPANDKRFARCEVLRIVCEGLERLF